MYDMKAMYLYGNGYRYDVGSIEKINDQTIRMSTNKRINKKDFETSTYKLTEEEARSYRGELVKKLSNSQFAVKEMIADLNKLRTCLNHSSLVEINTEKVQKAIDNLESILIAETPQFMTINGVDYKFENYGTSLEEVESCTK